jgi:predicted dienelactone hydrolase
LVAAALLGGCSSDDGGSGAAPPERHEVRQVEETFVDRTRVTPVNGTVAERPNRTLDTMVQVPDGDGPFPLVVFAHGFGATVEVYEPLLREWAAAGFVVAAPRFPLTYAGTPGGINGGDVENQPGDVSFVIDRILAESKRSSGDLAGVVDPDAIGVAGHSNGGITALGIIGNSCCRDPRIKAAAVLDGVDSPYSTGTYDLTDLPPTLWVHGTKDPAIGYDEAVRMFNTAKGPKALLSLEGADHGGWLAAGSPFPESFRPDQLGVMIVQTKWRNRPAFILKSAGRDPDEELLAWMRGFSVERGAPFFYERAGERFGFGPPEFQHEMLAKLESGERLW